MPLPTQPGRGKRNKLCAALLVIPTLLTGTLHAQGGLDFTHPVTSDSGRSRNIPDVVLRAAVAAFNVTGSRVWDGSVSALGDITGSLGVYRGNVFITNRVSGEVVVINGDVRIAATAHIGGRITVLGGHLTVDPGASISDTVVFAQTAPVERQGDNTLRIQTNPRSLGNYVSASISSGSFDGRARLSPGSYNRVEGFSPRLLASGTWHVDTVHSIRLDLAGVARTATASGENRPIFGGEATLSVHTTVPSPITIGVHAANVISPMADQPLPEAESSVSALLLRRDDRDWYQNKYWQLFAGWSVRPKLTLSGALTFSRETGVRAADVFSLLRSNEPWRPNPLIDDGNFVTASVGARWDTRDYASNPDEGTYADVQLSRVMSQSITPVTLPVSIRDEVPVKGYGSDQLSFDLRQYTRISPTQAIHLRLAGSGAIGGDPMTLQRRLAIGGGNLLPGYGFRAVNCDLRKAPDPSTPALCDRQLIAQVEYRRTLGLNLSTRVNTYTVGFQRPDLVVFGDGGSAWLAGAGVGQVPANRIQTLSEWRYDAGVGLDGGLFGIYVAKALTDHIPVQLVFRFSRPF